MFFNQDILFKNGALSIIWMAGNDELKKLAKLKGRRNKLYVRMLESDLSNLCDLVREQFPRMGTAKGLSLKKVATLVKGLGFIYFSKMEDLARNISETHVKLQLSTTGRLRQIDLPKTNRAAANLLNNEMDGTSNVGAVVEGFGELMEMEDIEFGVPQINEHNSEDSLMSPRVRAMDMDTSAFPQLIPTPPGSPVHHARKERNRLKRRRGYDDGDAVDEDMVMSKLQDALRSTAADAHCILDFDGIPAAGEGDMNFFGELNRGEGFGTAESGDVLNNEPPTENLEPAPLTTDAFDIIPRDEGLGSPPGRRGTQADENYRGIPRSQSSTDDEGTPVERQRRRFPPLELGSLEDDEGRVRVPLRGRRRSKRLRIDSAITIDSEVVRKAITEQKRPNDYDELRKIIVLDRALPTTNRVRTLTGNAFISAVGRSRIGRQLSDFVNSLLEGRDLGPEVQRLSERTGIDQSSAVREGEETGAAAGSVLPQDEEFEIPAAPNLLGDRTEGSENLIPFEQEQPFMEPPADYGVYGGLQDGPEQIIPAEEPLHPLRSPRDDRIEDVLRDDRLKEGEAYFRVLFPVNETSKKEAASGFFQLLRMQATGKLVLEQKEAYGDIIVRQVRVTAA